MFHGKHDIRLVRKVEQSRTTKNCKGSGIFGKHSDFPFEQFVRRHFFDGFAWRKRLKKSLLNRMVHSERFGFYARLVFETRVPKFLARF